MLGAALGASALVSPALLEKAMAAPVATLKGRPRNTYRALAQTVAAGDDPGYRKSAVADAVNSFDDWYRDQDEEVRGQVIALLEEIDAGFESGDFATASDDKKVKHVRDWAYPHRDMETPVFNITASEEEQREQIAKYAPGASDRMKDGDFTTVRPVPLAYDPPKLPDPPELNRAELRRAMLMEAALALVAHGFNPSATGSARVVVV